jgi:peptidoglycan/xylan/chitin deacetylase (PgdA/CDA1 family)
MRPLLVLAALLFTTAFFVLGAKFTRGITHAPAAPKTVTQTANGGSRASASHGGGARHKTIQTKREEPSASSKRSRQGVPAAIGDSRRKRLGLLRKFNRISPLRWSENVSGVRTRIKTSKKEVVLTLDACGSHDGCFDNRIISYLEKTKTPATIFVTDIWIRQHPIAFRRLKKSRLFEFENHGLTHRPASVNGRSQYGIQGTRNLGELFDEVEISAQKLTKATGRRPRFFRSGTAYYDEVAVKAINWLGYQVAGFDIAADAGATLSRNGVVKRFLQARPGSIILAHVNHPEKPSGEGVVQGIRSLRQRNFYFVKLSN